MIQRNPRYRSSSRSPTRQKGVTTNLEWVTKVAVKSEKKRKKKTAKAGVETGETDLGNSSEEYQTVSGSGLPSAQGVVRNIVNLIEAKQPSVVIPKALAASITVKAKLAYIAVLEPESQAAMSWEVVGEVQHEVTAKRARTKSLDRASAAVPIAAGPAPDETLPAPDIEVRGLEVVAEEGEQTLLPKASSLVSDIGSTSMTMDPQVPFKPCPSTKRPPPIRRLEVVSSVDGTAGGAREDFASNGLDGGSLKGARGDTDTS